MGVLHDPRRALIVQFPNLDLIPPLCQQTLGPRSKIVAKSVEQAHLPFAAKGACSEERERSDTELSHREKAGYSEREHHPKSTKDTQWNLIFKDSSRLVGGLTNNKP